MTAQAAVNFLPEDYVEKRAQSRSNIICIGLFIVVMTGIVGAYLFTQGDAAFAERDRVNQQCDDLKKKLTELQELKDQRQHMYEKAAVTAMLMEHVPRSDLIGALVAMKPKGASLLNLDLKSKELPPDHVQTKLDQARDAADPDHKNLDTLQAPPPQEVTLDLTGLAPNDGQVANYIATLGKCPILTDVNLLYSEEFMVEEVSLRKFKVEFKLARNADKKDLQTVMDINKMSLSN